MKTIYYFTYYFFLLYLFFLISCDREKWRNIELVSPDGKQRITIITKGNERFIMNGNHSKIMDSLYAKVDISNVDRLGDEIGICWDDNGKGWQLISLYSTVVENRLDTTKYKVRGGIVLDKRGSPTVKNYFNRGCDLLYPRGELIRPGNGTKMKFK